MQTKPERISETGGNDGDITKLGDRLHLFYVSEAKAKHGGGDDDDSHCRRLQIMFRREDLMRLRSLVNISVPAMLLGSGLCFAQDQNALKLWYRQPAGAWTQALPVGNGRLAAMVFGDPARSICNSTRTPSGRARNATGATPRRPRAFPEVRRLLLEGHPAEAQALADRTMISIPRALPVYQTLGDLWLDFGAGPEPADYRRELDLDTGIASVRYTAGGVRYVREVFASAPGQVYRRAADRRQARVTFPSAPR